LVNISEFCQGNGNDYKSKVDSIYVYQHAAGNKISETLFNIKDSSNYFNEINILFKTLETTALFLELELAILKNEQTELDNCKNKFLESIISDKKEEIKSYINGIAKDEKIKNIQIINDILLLL
jgi:hypothetical protein